jgi:hypothetical protein
MAIHTEWLGPELEERIGALAPTETHVLFHYLLGYLKGSEELKEALGVAMLEGKL